MPIPFALLLGFLLGVVFAWMARDELSREQGPLVLSRPVLIAAAFALFVYAPMVGYFAAFHGDWSYLYLYPHARLPSAVDLALVLVSGLEVPLGTYVAAPLARAKKLVTIVRLGAVPAALSAMLLAWGARRLSVSATYDQFHGGFGVDPITSSPLGRGVLVMAIAFLLGAAWSARCLGRTNAETVSRSRRAPP